MKTIKISAISALIALVIIGATLVNKSFASKKTEDLAGDGFAVLELFTSEGCSSCPPADELLARIQSEAGEKPVYVLSYHVDYWDRQGWRDVFSNPLFSKRQYRYGKQFTGQVYTPQVIVNGKAEFVGSDEKASREALSAALSGKPSTALLLKGQETSGKLKIDYAFRGDAKNDQLLIAVVEKHAISKVASGENAGRTLTHSQIVRDLYTIDPERSGNGTKEISLPKGFDTQKWEIVGFMQDRETGVIHAAARTQFNN
ncbi:DUF1223 domain-containing protein [Mucilaginibacter conchicola]|uniref:DUF1223 domain-containing protein n=1 Tax=Mucilaginibacter conchicola TaxID=2303333 RepID=A0A372NMM9_9SPHI|nr:DUF1223 domain-containing protein [Mucilaginibacter conchicola]RFZ90212.1 DUF1223 domain-containing protein [Mucilaginibacter conchicola]